MGEKVRISYEADIRDLVAKLKSVPGITEAEARKAVGSLDKSIKAAERAADAQAKASKGATAAFKTAEQQIGRNKEAIAQLGSAVSVVSPQIGGLVTQVGALTGAGKAAATAANTLGLSMGAAAAVVLPLAAALGVLVLVYQDAVRETRLEAELNETQRKAMESLIPVTRRLQDARLDLAAATGDLTEEELRYQRAALGAQRSVQDFASAQAKERAELQEIMTGSWWQVNPFSGQTNVLGSMLGRPEELEAARGRLAALDRALAGVADKEKEIRDDTIKAAAAREKNKGGGGGRGPTAPAGLVPLDAETVVGPAWDVAGYERAVQMVAEAQAVAVSDMVSESDRIIMARDAEIAKLYELAEVTGDRAAADAAANAVMMRSERELAKVRAADAKRQRAQIVAEADAYSDLFGALSGLSRQAAESLGKDHKEAAMVAFRAAQAAGLVQVAISTAVGIMKAWELPTPLNLIQAAAVAAMGATQAAAISSQEPPQFHSGGMMRGWAPDERPARLLAGEPVLTRKAGEMLGEHGVNALNRGESPTGPTVVQLRFRHRVLDEVFTDYARRPNPLRERVTVRGHRSGW